MSWNLPLQLSKLVPNPYNQDMNFLQNLDVSGNLGVNTSIDASYNLSVLGNNIPQGFHIIKVCRNNYPAESTSMYIDYQVNDTKHVIGRLGAYYFSSGSGGSGGLQFFIRNAGTITEAIRINQVANIGMGIGSPSYKLDINGTCRATAFIPFTGGHICYYSGEFQEGLLVRSTGKLLDLSSNIDNYPVEVELTTTEKDNAVYGILSQKVYQNKEETEKYEYLNIANGVGEGMILCVGKVKIGDLLTSSNLAGIAMKQDDDLIHSYTVGKVITNKETEEIGLVGCVYYCG